MTDEPTRERDPKERKTLEDALHIASGIVDSDGPVDSEQYILAAGFLVLCGDMAAMLDAAKKATHFCGWCQRANADSRIGLTTYTLDEVREHTVRCEHNPAVAERDSLRARLARVEHWTHVHGAALKPRGADTYGEGMRDAKEQVARILAAEGKP